MSAKLTKAQFATHVAVLNRLASRELSDLVGGMWNPQFCDDKADVDAFVVEVRNWLSRLEYRRSIGKHRTDALDPKGVGE